MMFPSKLATTGVVVLFGLLGTSVDTGAQQKHIIQGRVLDGAGVATGIVGVQIQILRGDRTIGQDQTKDGGNYKVSFDDGGSIDTVRYDHSDYFPGVLEDIYGRDDHTLHKTLFRRGQAQTFSYYQTEEILDAFERIQQIDKNNGKMETILDFYKYRAALEELDRLKLAPEFREQLNRIKAKYGIK